MGWSDSFLISASSWIQIHPSLFLFGAIFLLGSGIVITLREVDPLFKLEMKWSKWEDRRKKKNADRLDTKIREIQSQLRITKKEPVVMKPSSCRQMEAKSMNDLWSPDSLRGMYWRSQQSISNKDIAVSISNDVGFFKKMAMKLEAKTEIIKEHNDMVREFRKILRNPICPHCLKTIITTEISFSCPFCDKKHFEEGTKVRIDNGTITETVGAAIMTKMAEGMLMSALFNDCSKCQSKIQYLSCHHCQKEIDLFAPYNYQELERRRYGR